MTLRLSEQGITGCDDSGVLFRDPWCVYSGFYAGEVVIVCPKVNQKVYLRIPTESLAQSVRQEVAVLLSQFLPVLTLDTVRQQLNGTQRTN